MTPNEICAAILIGIGYVAAGVIIYLHFNSDDLYQKGIDTMKFKTVADYRAEQLKLMDQLIRCAADENVIDAWLMVGIPDGSTDEDFMSYGEDEDDYNEFVDTFIRMIQKPGYRY